MLSLKVQNLNNIRMFSFCLFLETIGDCVLYFSVKSFVRQSISSKQLKLEGAAFIVRHSGVLKLYKNFSIFVYKKWSKAEKLFFSDHCVYIFYADKDILKNYALSKILTLAL